jgi:hypothetical protein
MNGPLFAAVLLMAVAPARGQAVFHVSPSGDDRWSGRLASADPGGTDGPFATLERARDAIRALVRETGLPEGGVEVHLAGGIHPRRASFVLTAEDGGSAETPIVYRAAEGARPRLMGGALVTGFAPVTDEAILARLDEACRGEVLVADLRAQGVDEYGDLVRRGFGRKDTGAPLELYFRGERMQLARWPNESWASIAEVPEGKDGGVFTYAGERHERWAADADVWVHGYWTWDWADSVERVTSIDRAAGRVHTEAPHGVYGYKSGARFYFFNLLEELDRPGEWYLDRETGLLYFWPPAQLQGSEVQISLLDEPLVVLEDVSHVTLRGLALECSRGGGVRISGGAHDLVAGCELARLGTLAVRIDGTRNGLLSCDLFQLGEGGVSVGGGDRRTLTPAGNFAVNNHIHHFGQGVRTYVPAVALSGVGNRAAHNLIHDAPHMAIGLHGNDHLVEYNDVSRVCLETHDAGAFYMGRDWSQRGNAVRYNHFHDLGRGDVQAIYLDDWTSGVEVVGNLCRGARRGVLIGGGRDNRVENNVFVDCGHAVHIDERGKGWASYYFDGSNTTLFDRLEAVDATGALYTERYPELATLLLDDPVSAKGNLVARNVRWGGGWLELNNGLSEETEYLSFEHNWIEGDPGFEGEEAGNFALRVGAPVLSLGFRALPLDEIGLFADEYR